MFDKENLYSYFDKKAKPMGLNNMCSTPYSQLAINTSGNVYWHMRCFNDYILGNINNNPFYKSFLGNSGSLFIGYFLSFLFIHLYVVNNIHPAYLIWSVAYLVYEFLTVTILRLMNKKKFTYKKSRRVSSPRIETSMTNIQYFHHTEDDRQTSRDNE